MEQAGLLSGLFITLTAVNNRMRKSRLPVQRCVPVFSVFSGAYSFLTVIQYFLFLHCKIIVDSDVHVY